MATRASGSKASEIGRQVDHAAQTVGRGEDGAGAEQLAGARDRRLQHGSRKWRCFRAGHPHRVGAGDLPAVNPAQLAQLDPVCARAAAAARAPARRGAQLLAANRTPPGEGAELRRSIDRAHPHRGRRAADAKAGDRRGRLRVGERPGARIEDVQADQTERTGQEVTDEPTVVDVEPLARGDERAEVARPGALEGGEKKVYVQAGQPAGAQTVALGGGGQPALPRRRDVVVAHVRRVADEQRRTRRGRQAQAAVVAQAHLGAIGEAEHRERGTGHQRGQRIDVDSEQAGAGKDAGGLAQEPSGAGAGIDDAGRAAGGPRPRHHRRDDRRRRVGGAQLAPLAR